MYIKYITLFCGHITWRNWNSHIHQNQSGTSYLRPFCSLCPEEIVIVLMANLQMLHTHTHIEWKNYHYKFLVSMHNLGFRLLGFHHWVQWRGAKTVSKECWGPCHGLIPSLWDFAQNYSPQIERRDQNGRGTIYSLDSEKAIEPHISLVTECLSWSTLDWVVKLPLLSRFVPRFVQCVSWAGHYFSPAPADMT